MSDSGIQIIRYLLVGTLLVTGLIVICCYLLYGVEVAIISVFGVLLGFTVIHIVIFYFWLKAKG